MCGIAGFAGPISKLSKKLQHEFHEFLSSLFAWSEMRGRDAAGFWAWRGNHSVFCKRPIAAEELIKISPQWKAMKFHPGSVCIMHTRYATEGDPNDNINNHPHLGSNYVMVHNGCVGSYRTLERENNVEMKSNCDSEIILRLVEKHNVITDGLKDMYTKVFRSTGVASIACAFIDRRNPDRIFLSRNSGNPCVIYYSKRFNCHFFCSTESIFESAVSWYYGDVETQYKPKPEDEEFEKIEVHTYKLYELLGDGSLIEKEFMKEPTYSTSRVGFGLNYWDDNDTETVIDDKPRHDVIGKYTDKKYVRIQVLLDGTIIESSDVDIDTTEEQEDWEKDFREEESIETLPEEEKETLIKFLQNHGG